MSERDWSVVTSTGLVAEGETDVLYTPRRGRSGRTGVLVLHGAGGDATYANDPAAPCAMELFHHLADQGYTMLSSDWGGPATWGNDVAVARLDRGRDVLAARGCAADKVALVGVSMGGLNALAYASAHPDRVAAVAAIVPAADPEDFQQLNDDARAGIAAAHGVRPDDPLPTKARPILNAAALRQAGPIRLYYSTADTLTRPGPVEALAEAIAQPAVVISTTLGHCDAELGAVPRDDLVAFLRTAGC